MVHHLNLSDLCPDIFKEVLSYKGFTVTVRYVLSYKRNLSMLDKLLYLVTLHRYLATEELCIVSIWDNDEYVISTHVEADQWAKEENQTAVLEKLYSYAKERPF